MFATNKIIVKDGNREFSQYIEVSPNITKIFNKLDILQVVSESQLSLPLI